MENKSSNKNRNTRRRPPTLPLKPSAQLEALQDCRDSDDSSQAAAPVFASIHRPRHAGISSIKRDGAQMHQRQHHLQTRRQHSGTAFQRSQQNGLSFDLVATEQNCLPLDGAPANTSSNKSRPGGWLSERKQSIAGPIPPTFRQFPPGQQSMQHAFHHHQQQLQQQLQQQQHQQHVGMHHQSRQMHPPQQSRIPLVQPNFNQISKTATNLLNDIYEKHLLNQTTFDNVNMLHGRPGALAHAHAHTHAGQPTMPQSLVQCQNNSRVDSHFNSGGPGAIAGHGIGIGAGMSGFNLNNFHHKSQQKQSLNHHPNLQLPPPPVCPPPPYPKLPHYVQQNESPSVTVVQHVYETIPEKPLQPPPPPAHPVAPCNKQQLNSRNSGGSGGGGRKRVAQRKDMSSTSQRHQVPPGHGENYYQQQQQHQNHAPPCPNLFNNHQRSRADGENSCQSHLQLPRGMPIVVPVDTNKMECIREVPIGSADVHAAYVEESVRQAGLLANKDEQRLPVLVEEEFDASNGIAKYSYRNSQIDLRPETAQAMAAAAYYAKAAQKLAQSGTSRHRSTDMTTAARNGGFCGALQRAPPPMPPGLARRLANKENYGIGKVKVMLRVSDSHPGEDIPHFMAVDKKKRQVTLTDPSATSGVATSTSQERGPMVAAPKMFAFDSLFTAEDQQTDICASALSEVIPAVLEGSDGCLLTIGYPNAGQSRTMLGAVNTPNELGAIPSAISWLYKGINERRQKSGARFSVRVSALGVSATKPDSSSKDLLAAHATDSDDSPGVYLRDDFLGGPTELRAPTAERAALFLDAALSGRTQGGLEPAMIFTLHVYQYSLSRKGGVAGGRSRLHLIDMGGCANRNGGLPLSGLGNILLAILSGQRHPPNKDHPLTPLLKDCLAPLTCHVAIMAHVSHTQIHSDALTTIQLASRIHRMRRRKHRFPISSDKALGGNAGHQSAGSSEGPDPSSSDLSADTVIYMGPCDDATDGEHPPVYLPSLSSGDNRCAMSKVLKGSGVEKPTVKAPVKKISSKAQSPVVNRTGSLKRNPVSSSSPTPPSLPAVDQTPFYSPAHSSSKVIPHSASSPKIVAGALRHTGINKGSNVPSPKGSPLRRPSHQISGSASNVGNPESPMRKITEEQWIDGPRVSRAKVAEARHLMREINHIKQCETWIDGPKSQSAKSLTAGNLPNSGTQAGYGFMDSHKKTMIRQWVENQSSQVFQSSAASSPTHLTQQQQAQLRNLTYQLSQLKQKSEEDQHSMGSNVELVHPIGAGLTNATTYSAPAESSVRSGLRQLRDDLDMHSDKSTHPLQMGSNHSGQDEEDQDSGPSEVPPALPLITPLGSREISHESLHRIISRHVSRESLALSHHHMGMSDCGLQVTEDEIARTMGHEHPLAALSHGDMSVVSSFNIGDAFSDCAMGERARNQFDQLARLREIFTSQLAMAEVTPHVYRLGNDVGSVYSEPAFRFNTGPGSVCSEPPYRPPSPRQSLNASRTSSQTSLPSLNGIMQIAGMEQYASLRHPDGASDPNLPKSELPHAEDEDDINEKSSLLSKRPSIDPDEKSLLAELPIISQTQLPLLPLNTSSEAYDSGHDSSTPRTSKHSGISRRAESGYHSVATARDSDESSFTSALSKEHNRITMKKKRQDKSLCNWLMNPFTCTYPETEGEISDF